MNSLRTNIFPKENFISQFNFDSKQNLSSFILIFFKLFRIVRITPLIALARMDMLKYREPVWNVIKNVLLVLELNLTVHSVQIPSESLFQLVPVLKGITTIIQNLSARNVFHNVRHAQQEVPVPHA